MTVIALRDGILAADSMCSDNCLIVPCPPKIGRLPDGTLWAFCGFVPFLEKCLEGVQRHSGDGMPEWEPRASDDSTFILVKRGGMIREWWGKGWVEYAAPEMKAWGAGDELALGAMAAGADAKTACEIACRFNIYCGGEVVTLDLEPEEPEPVEVHTRLFTDREELPGELEEHLPWRERMGL